MKPARLPVTNFALMMKGERVPDYVTIGFEKIERDLRFLMECLAEVLGDLGHPGMAAWLPWSGRRFPSVWNGVLGRRSSLSKWFPNARALTDYLYREEIAAGAPFEADWVSAAAMLVRREAFAAAGGFAEDYYYWHEAVFCDRIRKIGRKVFLDPRSNIVHYEGKGSGPRPYRVKRWHIIDFHRGAYRCYCEHYNMGRFHPARWMTAAALGIRAGILLAGARLVSPK